MDKLKIKEQIINFTIKGVSEFLKNNPELEFYAFAYDCNAEYAELNLCFNTLLDFEKTLDYYQNGKFGQKYKSDEDIRDLKYNTGDWEYQCFESMNILSDEELNDIFAGFPDDDYRSWNEFVESVRELFCECLLEFRSTKTFESIPKSKGFISFCIDHDEGLEIALERLKRIKL
ncbi:MAG: DUF4303 domain-containing protein [Flavobacterium sp.]